MKFRLCVLFLLLLSHVSAFSQEENQENEQSHFDIQTSETVREPQSHELEENRKHFQETMEARAQALGR